MSTHRQCLTQSLTELQDTISDATPTGDAAKCMSLRHLPSSTWYAHRTRTGKTWSVSLHTPSHFNVEPVPFII